MNKVGGSRMIRNWKKNWISLSLALGGIVFISKSQAHEAMLHVYEGLIFASGKVVESASSNADVKFYVQMDPTSECVIAQGTIGANRIKAFGLKKPSSLLLNTELIQTWQKEIKDPQLGYYVIRSLDRNSFYTFKLIQWLNKDQAPTSWRFHVSWEKLY